MSWLVKPLGNRLKNVWVNVGVILSFLVAGLTLFIFFPAIIFSAVDGWSYSESLYYCFVTLTTVGFGDFVPGIPESRFNGLYRICAGAWIFVGLAFVALVISLMQEVHKHFEKKIRVKCKCVEHLVQEEEGLQDLTTLDNSPEHVIKEEEGLQDLTTLDNSPEKPESSTEQN